MTKRNEKVDTLVQNRCVRCNKIEPKKTTICSICGGQTNMQRPNTAKINMKQFVK